MRRRRQAREIGQRPLPPHRHVPIDARNDLTDGREKCLDGSVRRLNHQERVGPRILCERHVDLPCVVSIAHPPLDLPRNADDLPHGGYIETGEEWLDSESDADRISAGQVVTHERFTDDDAPACSRAYHAQ